MNYREMFFLLAEIALIFAGILLIPLFVAVGFLEEGTIHAFGLTIVILVAFGVLGVIFRPKKEHRNLKPSCAMAICGIAWIVISLIGALPYCLSGYIPSYIDALFESVSGVTTTGATILTDIEALPKSLLLWRSLSQWIGGMGVLVFIIAILPKNDKVSTQLVKAEMPGPQFGKLVGKLRFTAQILYAIYIVFTIIEAIILICLKMPVFDSFCHAFATASTGGFSVKNTSIAYYNSVGIEVTITVFMMLFSVNFNVFYMIMAGQIIKALKNEETIWMFALYFISVIAITVSLIIHHTNDYSVADSIRYSSFQVASMMSTTGFGLVDFSGWPMYCQCILIGIMFLGGSAGSTAGGLKISRFMILMKSSALNIKKSLSPRSVNSIKIDGKPVSNEIVNGVERFFILYMVVFITSCILISIQSPLSEDGADGLVRCLSAVVACFNNVGPGLMSLSNGIFTNFNVYSKIILIIDMLLGRLEIMPILLIFYPKIWKPAKIR